MYHNYSCFVLFFVKKITYSAFTDMLLWRNHCSEGNTMRKALTWLLAGMGGLLVVYSLLMAFIGELLVAQTPAEAYQHKLGTGLTIALSAGSCGAVLLGSALMLWLVARRRMPAAYRSLATVQAAPLAANEASPNE